MKLIIRAKTIKLITCYTVDDDTKLTLIISLIRTTEDTNNTKKET